MTHILIPTKDIDLEELDLMLALVEDSEHGKKGKAITEVRSMLSKGKQISLNEEDIEEKALTYFKRAEPEVWAKYAKLFNHQSDMKKRYNGDKEYILKAFGQALKDLL